MTRFQINDPSLESQWRALILFGKNSATYKFAFAKSLLEIVNNETTKISLTDLSQPFSKNIIEARPGRRCSAADVDRGPVPWDCSDCLGR